MTDLPAPLVSAVVPTIRLDTWFDEALHSLLGQEGINLQLIVILDGVGDHDHHPWMDDPRVTVLSNEHRLGVGRTLKKAMEHAEGEFVARLDADDVAKPGRLAKQANYLASHPDTVAVSARTELINGQGAVIGELPFASGPDVRPALLLQNVVVQSAVMFRQGDYRAVGGYEPMRQMEDYHLWLRLAQRGKIAILPDVLAQYRVHETQLSLGAKPFGEHIVKVLNERRNLRRSLGTSALAGMTKDLIWAGVQYLRYYVLVPAKRRLRKA
ncbi:glycosyltransferase [[Micrococcus luteus] ATCC 49442]|uniref:glycosyltransferase n=1 Tax=[Micrococcus luteus] ATCC 49442 TaxID=2698727 RepID=UPI0013DB51B9|nr:glycosyltransferase [[Micrococcus luteus] ATCC 49442]